MKTLTLNHSLMYLSTLLMSLLSMTTFAAMEAEDKSPLGCRDVGYQFTLKTLDLLPENENTKQSLYFMFNRTTTPIGLFQMRSPNRAEGMSINHVIPPHSWAALSLDEVSVKYACTRMDGKSAYGQIVDCSQHIKVCEFARVKYGMNNRGNFWMVAGNTKNGALREVTNYGVIAK